MCSPYCSEDSNILEAAARGATSSIKVISYAVAILIAFFGLLALLNDFLSWVGSMVGHPDLSFEVGSVCGGGVGVGGGGVRVRASVCLSVFF